VLAAHDHRTSVDEFPTFAHVIMEIVHVDHVLVFEKVDVLLGGDWLVTVQDRPGDCFDGSRRRLREDAAFRSRTIPFLLHSLALSVCHSYQTVLARFGTRLEQLEMRLIARPSAGLIHRIHAAKRDLRGLRRAVVPLRESIETLFYANRRWSGAGQSEIACGPDLYLALREMHDGLGGILDILDAYRDAAQNLTDLYVTSASNRVNDILRVLTIISTIFIPLSFVAGIYGMNFEHMPETKWEYGYPFALAIMGIIAAVLLVYFWRKGWLRRGEPKRLASVTGHAAGHPHAPAGGLGGHAVDHPNDLVLRRAEASGAERAARGDLGALGEPPRAPAGALRAAGFLVEILQDVEGPGDGDLKIGAGDVRVEEVTDAALAKAGELIAADPSEEERSPLVPEAGERRLDLGRGVVIELGDVVEVKDRDPHPRRQAIGPGEEAR
jgi:magnesium transporter